MTTASPARPAMLTLACLLLAAGCSGENKPAAATAPATDADKKDEAKAGKQPVDPGKTTAANSGGGDKVKVVEGGAPGVDDRYALQIEPPADAAAGKESEVIVRVVPKAPWHINLDFPTSLKLDPPAGVTLASKELKKADARKLDDNNCEFAVKLTPSAAGEHALTGQLKFAVCQDEACSPVTQDVEIKLAAK
jgi:hypothetical protein